MNQPLVSDRFPYLPVTVRTSQGSVRLIGMTEVDAPTYRGYVQLGSFPEISAQLTVVGEETLIGTRILRHFAVLLDHGQRVIVIES